MTTEPCAGCPFKGCPDCQWKGGSVVVAQQNSGECERIGAQLKRPLASTRGLTAKTVKES